MNNNLREAIQRANVNLALSAKHPRIIMNGAGMFISGAEMMVPIDGIPASFFNGIALNVLQQARPMNSRKFLQ